MQLNNGIRLTWLGHSTFKIEADEQTLLSGTISQWDRVKPRMPHSCLTSQRSYPFITALFHC